MPGKQTILSTFSSFLGQIGVAQTEHQSFTRRRTFLVHLPRQNQVNDVDTSSANDAPTARRHIKRKRAFPLKESVNLFRQDERENNNRIRNKQKTKTG